MVFSVRSASACLKRAACLSASVAHSLAKTAPGLALAVSLAACGDTSVGSSLMNMLPGAKPTVDASATPQDISKYTEKPACPNAEIRYGTEAANVYLNNKPGDDTSIKYQLNVQRVARECDEVGPNMVVRVGAAGLVVGGPKGTPGKVDIPVRIAAVNGDKVLFSNLKVVSVQVNAPDFSGDWSLVDTVNVPSVGSANTIIYVGIDDKSKPAQAKPGAAADATEAKPRPHRPRPKAPAGDPSDPYPQMKPNIPQ